MTANNTLPQGWKKYNLFEICKPKQWKTIAVKDLTDTGCLVLWCKWCY